MNNNHVVEILVQIKDRATDPLKKLVDQTRNMSNEIRNSGTHFGAFNNFLDNSTKKIDAMANSMYRFNMRTADLTRSLKNLGAISIFGGAALGVDSIKKAVDFEQQMYVAQTRMNVGDGVRNQLKDYIMDLNKTTSFTNKDLADMSIEIGSAGISDISRMKSILRNTAYFAETTGAKPTDASSMIISAANGFNLDLVKDSSHISDVLATALNQSKLDPNELPHAIGEVAGRARMLGQTLESTMTALSAAKNQGLNPAQASQNLIHGLLQLNQAARPDLLTPKRAEVLEKAGINMDFFDLDRKSLKTYPELIEALENSMANSGLMPNKEEFFKKIAENGGQVPDDIVNRMKAAPLLAKVLGISGATPFLMGLQSRYDITNPETGEVEKTLYGSEALKQMQKEMENSTGKVEENHKKMSETSKHYLDALGSSWENLQVKAADHFLPVLKETAKTMDNWLNGKDNEGALNRIARGFDDVGESLKDNHPIIAEFVKTLGNGAVNAVKIAEALKPTGNQFGESFNSLMKSEWGNSIWTMPYYATKNGLGFMWDITRGNKESDKAISQLHPELQDEAKLVRNLIQGGAVLVISGAIIKILELGLRAVSLAGNATKFGTSIIDIILKAVTGGNKGDIAKSIGELGKTMAINANIVNVYGKAINTGLDLPGDIGGGKPGSPSSTPKGGSMGSRALNILKSFGTFALGEGMALPIVGEVLGLGYLAHNKIQAENEKERDPEQIRLRNLNAQKVYANTMDNVNKNYEKGIEFKNAINQGFTGTSNALTNGFNKVERSIQNIKINNNVNVQVNPNINLFGDLKEGFMVRSQENDPNANRTFHQFMGAEARRYSGNNG